MPPAHPSAGLLAAIDQCEQFLVGVLRSSGGKTDWAGWRREVREARRQCVGDDASLVTVLEELEILAAATMTRAASVPAPDANAGSELRFGYGIITHDERITVTPTFATLLCAYGRTEPRRIAKELPGLSVADATMWRAISKAGASDVRALALQWLMSPARRVAWNLSTIATLNSEDVIAAVGDPHEPRSADAPEMWPALHSNVPLHRTESLQDAEAVIRALRTLAAPSWFWSRSQAVAALLQRAVTTPEYTAGGLRIDLREELPARIGAVLDVPDDEALLALERELLRVALAIVPDETRGTQVFAVARWIGYILAQSPFYANDPSVLAAHLSSIQHTVHPSLTPRAADSLAHPRRLMEMLADSPAAWREFGIVVGAAAHYLGPVEEPRLTPVPVTLLDFLHRTATRPIQARESQAESDSSARVSVEDPRERHLATPWIARAVLHRARVPWLPSLSYASLEDVLRHVSRTPQRYAWVLESLWMTPRQFSAEARSTLERWWAATKPSPDFPEHVLALVASAAPHEIIARHETVVLALLEKSKPDWRAFAAFTLANECSAAGLSALERKIARTFDLVASDESLSVEQRLRALEWWVRRLQGDRSRMTPEDAQRLTAFASMTWVQRRPRLVTEFGVLGVDSRAHSGGVRR